MPKTKIWIWLSQQEIAKAGDEGQRKYEDDTDIAMRTEVGLNNTINSAMDLKRSKLNAPFTKYLAIVNPRNGDGFLAEVWYFLTLHNLRTTLIGNVWNLWSIRGLWCRLGSIGLFNSIPEMTTEKVQYLAASAIDGQEKVKILKL